MAMVKSRFSSSISSSILQGADRVERAGRLVQQDHLRPCRDGARDAQALLLAAGQAGGGRWSAGPSPRATAPRGSATTPRARPSRPCSAARAASPRRRCCRRSTSGTASASGTPCRCGCAACSGRPRGEDVLPSIITSPLARWPGYRSYIRFSTRSSVDLPQPDGPIMPVTCGPAGRGRCLSAPGWCRRRNPGCGSRAWRRGAPSDGLHLPCRPAAAPCWSAHARSSV